MNFHERSPSPDMNRTELKPSFESADKIDSKPLTNMVQAHTYQNMMRAQVKLPRNSPFFIGLKPESTILGKLEIKPPTNMIQENASQDMFTMKNKEKKQLTWRDMELLEALCIFLTEKFRKTGIELASVLEGPFWKDFPDLKDVEDIITFIEDTNEEERDRTKDVSIVIPFDEADEEYYRYDHNLFRKWLRGCAYLPWEFDCSFEGKERANILAKLHSLEVQLQIACASHYGHLTANKLVRYMVSTSMEGVDDDHFLLTLNHEHVEGDIFYFPVRDIMQKNKYEPRDTEKKVTFKTPIITSFTEKQLNLIAKYIQIGPSLFFDQKEIG